MADNPIKEPQLRDTPQNIAAAMTGKQTPAQQINAAMQTAAQQQTQPQAAQLPTKEQYAQIGNAMLQGVNDAMAKTPAPSAQTQANAQTTQEAMGGVYRVQDNGQAPKGLKVGDQVVTAAGTYTIKSVNADGTYQSQLTNPGQTTGNYGGSYANAPVAPTNVYKVGADGNAPKGLKVGDQVVTGGGTYQITGVNADGSYQSQLINANQTTGNYTGSYATPPGTAPATQPATPNYAKSYQSGIDYAAEIQKALARGDLAAAAYFEQQRNAKIDAEGLGDKYSKTDQYSQYLSQLSPERQAQLMNGYVTKSAFPENPQERWMNWVAQWSQGQQDLLNSQIDYAVDKAVTEQQRVYEDALPKFQQQLNQLDIDTARAMSNSALYAEARGDRGGIGQSQYNEVQAAGLRAKQEINSARIKLATDTARAIADARRDGDFKKAEAIQQVEQERLAKYFEIENAIMNYGITRAEYEQAKEQADFNRDYQLANIMGTYNGQPTYSAQKYEQETLQALGEAKLKMGVMPTAQELAALNMTEAQAAAAVWNLSGGAYGISGGSGNFSPGGSYSDGGSGSSGSSGSGSGGSGSNNSSSTKSNSNNSNVNKSNSGAGYTSQKATASQNIKDSVRGDYRGGIPSTRPYVQLE